MPETPTVPGDLPKSPDASQVGSTVLSSPSTSLRDLFAVLYLRLRFVSAVCGSLLLACLLYCLIAPNQYEASARVALRTAPATALHLDGSDPAASGALASGQVQLETLAGMLRGEQLAWTVIADERLYLAPAFLGRFGRKFPGLNPHAPTPEAQAYLLDRFERRLTVRSLPRTMILQIRFRWGDAALSAAVVNDLIRAYRQRETEVRVEGTEEATEWLNGQLTVLKAQVERDDAQLMAFLILPSRREGFPNAVLEASSGIPVITTFATGARNAVVAGVTGLLIPKGSPAAICAASLDLLRDRERRMRMGREARAWVLEYYPEKEVLGMTAAFYRNLCNTVPVATRTAESNEAVASLR